MSNIETNVRLEDCGEQTIICSDCSRKLMHYRVYAPEVPVSQKIQCLCGFCGGRSFIKTIQGLMYQGPIGKDEGLTPTVIKDIVSGDDGIWVFEIIKG